MGFLAGLIASGVGVFLKVLAWLKSRNDAAAQHDRGVQAEEVAKNQGAVLEELKDAKAVSDASDRGMYLGLSGSGANVTPDDGYRRD